MTDLKREACFIAGEWRAGTSWISVDDPATGELIGRVPSLGADEARQAIVAASAALGDWAARTAAERATVLRRFHELMLADREPLARLLTREQGKPLGEARAEITYAASFFEWYAEEAKRAYGEIIPAHARDRRILVLRQPIGVVAVITPWNFPSAMITRKIAPALAAGCAVVVKPAEQTPFSALALAAIGERAGLPAGLLNVITGSAASIGGELTTHPLVRKVSFTGSTATGALLYGQAASTIKKLSLELGGNAPFLVFDDASLDAAVAGAIQSKFRNAGQTCVCSNRFIVQSGIHDAFVARLAEAAAQLRIGPASRPDSEIGPLIDAAAIAKVRALVGDAVARGAALVCGGADHPAGARFYTPTVLSGVTPAMQIAREEVFGPVAPVMRFDTEGEALAIANDTESGLAAYLFSRDLARCWRVMEALETGMVGVNTGLISTEVAPFGGIKQSGIGREGSRHGLDDYLELKYACLAIG